MGKKLATLLFGMCLLFATSAMADNFSFTGHFNQDDDVQLFNFAVGADSTITLRAWSYAGGVNAAGQTIARGGFDTILALFNSSGALIGQNDDGGCGLVAADAGTGRCWDTFLQTDVTAGNYTVGIMQYDNFANGPFLANGFRRQGTGNFTGGPFRDVSGVSPWNMRDNHWAFDILNVETAVQTPEPGSMMLLGTGLMGLAGAIRRRLGK